mmetsp:Transcript_16775/g.65524  ORF Transcript_16775/g.65524 Transcript_16775/m.65524 type:complete len:216 (+) Transcript_16775:460-1107(+)
MLSSTASIAAVISSRMSEGVMAEVTAGVKGMTAPVAESLNWSKRGSPEEALAALFFSLSSLFLSSSKSCSCRMNWSEGATLPRASTDTETFCFEPSSPHCSAPLSRAFQYPSIPLASPFPLFSSLPTSFTLSSSLPLCRYLAASSAQSGCLGTLMPTMGTTEVHHTARRSSVSVLLPGRQKSPHFISSFTPKNIGCGRPLTTLTSGALAGYSFEN